MSRTDAILKRLSGLHPKLIDLSLDRILPLLEELGNPHEKLPPVIHVGIAYGSFEPHTATFGPGDITDPNSYLGAIAKSFESPAIDPKAIYPSDTGLVSLSQLAR